MSNQNNYFGRYSSTSRYGDSFSLQLKKIKKNSLIALMLTISLTSFADYDDNPIDVQIFHQGRDAGIKAINNIPLLPLPFYPSSEDFTVGGINSLSNEQQEIFRRGFTKGLTTVLGGHTGWKYGLTAATSTAPSLGYVNPIVGELLKKMIIVGDDVNINPNYALSTANEADLLFVVKSRLINNATTPRELLQHIEGVYPAIELPATFTPRFLPDALGPVAGGDGILRATNIAARLFVRSSTIIPIEGSRSLDQWEMVLNGGLQVQDLLTRSSGNVSGVGGPIRHLDNFLRLITDLKSKGLKLKPGDLVSPGTAVAVRISNGTEQSFTVTYDNLDPNGVVVMKVNFTPDGLTMRKNKDSHKHDD